MIRLTDTDTWNRASHLHLADTDPDMGPNKSGYGNVE